MQKRGWAAWITTHGMWYSTVTAQLSSILRALVGTGASGALVQTFNSLGAHRSGGRFVSTLNREVVGEYASQSSQGRLDVAEIRVDYHNILFYLSIIHRLLQAIAQPEREASIFLLDAWGDAKPRLRQAIDLLADTPLSGNPYAAQFRGIISEWRVAAAKSGDWQL